LGIIISGLVVITMLLLASGVMFSTFLNTSVTGAQSLKNLTQSNIQRVGSSLAITSGGFDLGSNTELTVVMDNSGSQPVVRLNEMDVIIDYTDSVDNSVLTRLAYTSAALGNNEWTLGVTGVTPDTFNPGMWDSDETMYIDMKLDPAVKSGTSAVVVVGSPWAVTDQTSLAAP